MEKIYREGYNFFFWEYEPQTKIKHFVFQEYFDKWVKILGKWNELNYFDCYAGSGAYLEKDNIYYGSPRLEDLLVENIDSVPFLESNIKNTLKDMEGEEIKIKRTPELTPTGRKRKSIELNDIIFFNGE